MNRETLINTPLPRKLVWAHTPEMKISKKISKLSNLGQKLKSKIFKSHQKLIENFASACSSSSQKLKFFQLYFRYCYLSKIIPVGLFVAVIFIVSTGYGTRSKRRTVSMPKVFFRLKLAQIQIILSSFYQCKETTA